jgi:hypothetical protein
VIGDIKTLAIDFESCLFKFSCRSLNMVAHKLAHSTEPLVCNLSSRVILKFIRDELCNDVFEKKVLRHSLSKKNINVVSSKHAIEISPLQDATPAPPHLPLSSTAVQR